MSTDPFTSHQTEYAPEHVAELFSHERAHTVNMRAALTGHAYPVSGDTLRREQVKAGQWAHLRQFYAGGNQ